MCPRTPAEMEQQVEEKAALLEVVGGAAKGGIIVRAGRETSSEELSERLSTGSVVRALESDGGRVYYEMVRGFGPLRGWVSTNIQDKVLLAACDEAALESAEEVKNQKEEEAKAAMALQLYGDLMASEQVEEMEGFKAKQAFPWSLAAEKPEAQVRAELVREMVPEGEAEAGAPEKAAAGSEGKKQELQATFGYPAGVSKDSCFARFDIRDEVCRRFGGFKHGQVVFYREAPEKEFAVVGVKLDRRSGQERLWLHPQDLSRPGSVAVQPEDLECLMPVYKGLTASIRKRVTLSPVQASGFEALEDSDGEGVLLCSQCRLPVGTTLYSDQDGNPMHAECMAQRVQRDLRGKEEQLQKKEASEKKACRDTYCIGWSAKQIPLNVGPAQKLSLASAPRGMCCLMLEEGVEGPNVRVLPTMDPACSVNLEYLSLALKVRYTEGREPTFSLDPVVETGALPELSKKMQLKNFEPQWLKGTSVGEVLFQSDYHLKELSMGEQQQPVVGMRSCFDLSAGEAGGEWRAREWYVVRSAEMQLSEDNVLIPHVEMAIEAREQINGAHGIEDSPITRPNHPLVKYAEAFTQNFDLIAERRSAIYHLRELAKASVLAKFLIEGGVNLRDTWFHLAGQPRAQDSLVIPQVWNDRCHSQVEVQDGRIVEAEAGVGSKKHSVYGGVEFGLDRFSISRPSLASGAMLARGAAAQMSRVLGVTSVRQLGPPIPGQPLRAGIEAQAHLQGVDLNLSKFDLTSATREVCEGPAAKWSPASGAAAGEAFWANIARGSKTPFSEEDASFLRAVFNPHLSDRRADGDKFVPPDTSFGHVQALRELVEEEAQTRERRKEHFCGKDFVVGDAGPVFPSSWTSSFEITRGQVLQRVPGGADVLPEHYKPYTDALPPSLRDLRSTTPIFDKTTEDGTRFRIYRCSGLEVRTIQENEGREAIGVVFAVSASMQASMDSEKHASIEEDEKVAKVTEYVESAASDLQPLARNFYVVVETVKGNVLVTEMLENGTVVLEANPEALPDRNSRARIVRSSDCRSAGACIRDVNACGDRDLPSGSSRASVADRKHYAQVAYGCAKGEPASINSGFSARTAGTWSELKEKLGLSKSQMEAYFPSGNGKNQKGKAFGGVLRL
mmetsp:Transcript_49391/g.118833  ORF Transcript_49391/g.118833 Transcript_49391/m.118833 type:complete len:1127 (-) Transcript_49391:67-3447(-)